MRRISKYIFVFLVCMLYFVLASSQTKAFNLMDKIREDKESIVGIIANKQLRASGQIVLNASNNLGEEKINLSWTDNVEYPVNYQVNLSLNDKGLADGWGSYYVGNFTIYEACQAKVDFYYSYWGNEPRNGNTTVEIWLIYTSTTGQKSEKRIISQVQSSNKQDFTFSDSFYTYLDEGYYEVQIRGNKPKWHGMLNVRGYINFSTSNTRVTQYTIQQSKNKGEFVNIATNYTDRNMTLTAANGVRDQGAPTKPNGRLEAVRGDRNSVNVKVNSTDTGTSFEYKVIGTKNGVTATSNTTEPINIITGLKGFSYVIDKNSNTEPDNQVDYEVNVQADKMAEIGIKLDKKYVNTGYYLHVKAIDKVGNVSDILHIPLDFEERELNLYKTYQETENINDRGLSETAGWNYIDLDWDKLAVRTEYQNPAIIVAIDRSGSMTHGDKIGKAKNAAKTFVTNILGKLPQSQIGVIGFSNDSNIYINPTNNLQEILNAINGIDLWDRTFTATGVNKAREMLKSINTKNKVLVIITDGKPEDSWEASLAMANARSEGINIITLSIEVNNSTLINGSDSHYLVSSGDNSIYNTLSQTIYNNIIDSVTPKYNLFRKKEGDLSYTQVTNEIVENAYSDKDAKDLTGPLKPIGRMTLTKDKQSLNFKVWVEDAGTSYDYYVEAIMGNTGEIIYSNNVIQEVKTGVKGFAWTIDSNSNTDPGSNITELPESFDKSYIGKYIHVRGIDYAGNLGQVLHLMIDDGRLIPEEELDQTKELFCVQHGQTIPALVDGRYLNATVKAGSGEYEFTQTVEYPNTGDIIGRRFVEGTTNNIYGTEDIITYSIGKYRTSLETPTRKPGKEGNANEKEAYILSYYSENDGVDSDDQKAMYTTDVSSGNITWDWDDTPNSKALVAEANAYESYRKARYNPEHKKKETNVYMSEDYSYLLLGPLKLKYEPKGISVNGSKRGDIYFSKIIGAKLYDQDGNIFAEKDINGNTVGNVQWEFVYTNTGLKRSEYLFSYDKYKFPVGDEEFYIRIKYSTELNNVTEISKIEFTHEEMIADAQYEILEGTYNKVAWTPNRIKSSDRDVLWCNEVEQGKTECIHGKNYSHIIGCYFYLTATVYDSYRDIPSQKLIEVDWAKRYYKYLQQVIEANTGITDPGGDDGDDDKDPTDPGGDDGDDGKDPTDPGGDDGDDGKDPTDPGGDNGDDGKDPTDPGGDDDKGSDEWKLVMDFDGNVWDDGIEDNNNGIKETTEHGIEKVLVKIYRVDKYGNRLGQAYQTYTDSSGNYEFENIIRGVYDIEFEYDGQTYITTKLLVNGNIEDYNSSYSDNNYYNNSMVLETKQERQNFNNKFEEIAGNNSAYGSNGKIDLEYVSSNRKSDLQTLRDGYVKNEFKISARSSSANIYYPISEKIIINGEVYIKIIDINDVNMGLAERLQTDENLKVDVYESTFSIKDSIKSFIHSARDIRDINSNRWVNEYIQYVNKADYNWRWDEDLGNIWESPAECELEAYVDYIIVIRNSGEKDFVRISELADYYDKSYEYSSKYRDFDLTSWAVLKEDDPTESSPADLSQIIKVDWNENSKYEGVNNPYSDYYNKMYTNSLEQLELKKGQYIELHIVFRVLKDDNRNILLDQTGEGKKNLAEINGYKTYYIKDGSIAGLVDSDSKPGNLNPLNDTNTFEDDEDRAPNYKLLLDDSGNDSGDDEDGDDGIGGNHGDGEDNVNKDDEGNIVGYGNVIEGNVWEDLRTGEYVQQLINNQIVGDGIRQQEEPLVNNVKIDLIEMFENKTTGYKMERIVDSQNTRLLLSLSNDSKLDGGYRFDELPTGKYKVQFTYGTQEQLTQDLKYNGQDFQGIKTDDIYKDSNTQNNYDNVEIMLNMDVSNSMTGEKIDNVKKSSIKLIENLYDRLPGIKIGIVQFRNEANILVNPTNDSNQVIQAIQNMSASGETAIAQGIEKTIEAYSDDIDQKIMIILTDGKETIDNNEDVIRQIESATDKNNIDLITLLTEDSKQIFGTEEHPRRGKLYLLSSNNNIENLITNTIYQELLELSIVKKDRSFGKDIQGDEDTPGTRIYNMNKYKVMGIQNAEVLNIERVSKLQGNDRIEAIKKIADTTYMTAITEPLQVQANNVGISKIEQINLGIRERPKVELTFDSEIQTIKVTLSDGTVIIDTEKGLSKNVMGTNKKGVPISVYMDEEIMHGANIIIKYKIRITNTGEIDRLSNYIENGDDSTIPTRATIVYNYTNKNALFKTDTDNDIWYEITQEEAKNNINSQVLESIRDGNKKIYKTEKLNVELYPIGSVELQSGENNYIEVVSTISKVISPQDTTETLSFDSMMEIIQRYNEAGRRSYTSIPGNYVVGSGITEPDSTENSRVIITKPLGANLSLKYICIALAVLSILLIIILVIKLKLDNNKKQIIYK